MLKRWIARDGSPVCLRLATEGDVPQLIQAVDSVARERAYFIRSRFQVDEDQERAFIGAAQEREDLILLAVADEHVVGWVTLLRARPEFLRHTVELGMGVVKDYRGLGIGTALLSQAIQWAAAHSIEKINLGVRATNRRAHALYRRFSFAQEGYRVREVKDPKGDYDDIAEMTLFLPAVGDVRSAAEE